MFIAVFSCKCCHNAGFLFPGLFARYCPVLRGLNEKLNKELRQIKSPALNFTKHFISGAALVESRKAAVLLIILYKGFAKWISIWICR